MEYFGVVLVLLVAPAMGLLGVVAFFKPIPALRLRTRAHAGLAVGLGFGALVLGFVLIAAFADLPAPSPDGSVSAEPPADRAPRPAAAPGPKAEDAPPARRGVATQAEFDALFYGIDRFQTMCSERVAGAGALMSGSDVYAAYDAARTADETCSRASMDIRALRSPRSSRGDARASLNKMIEECATTATHGAIAMERASKVLNGDDRPSAVADVRQALAWIESASGACTVQVVQAALANGVTVPGGDS